jgi:quercetin dioxygenase-like cupin family protein
MRHSRLEDYTRGWFIGDFEPALLRTKDFEVSVFVRKKGTPPDPHYHHVAEEYNVLISGRLSINGYELVSGDVFVIERDEVTSCVYHEDCTIVAVKVPSCIGDKYV